MLVEPVVDELRVCHVVALSKNAQAFGGGVSHGVFQVMVDHSFGCSGLRLSFVKGGYADREGVLLDKFLSH